MYWGKINNVGEFGFSTSDQNDILTQRDMGKDVSLEVQPGTGHAFMAPHNALGTYDQAAYHRIWPQVLAFLHEQLD